jgi:hypothetical protein
MRYFIVLYTIGLLSQYGHWCDIIAYVVDGIVNTIYVVKGNIDGNTVSPSIIFPKIALDVVYITS